MPNSANSYQINKLFKVSLTYPENSFRLSIYLGYPCSSLIDLSSMRTKEFKTQ